MKELAKSELNLLQIEIVEELLSGRRTIAELVEAIYSLRRGEAGYGTQYSRVRREILRMESEGLVVSKGLFGRQRPYALTQLAVAKLTSIQGVETGLCLSVFPRIDLAVYGVVLALGAAAVVLAGKETAPVLSMLATLLFVFTAGIAVTRFIQTLRRVT